MYCPLNLSDPSSVRPREKFSIDPISCHIFVTAQLYGTLFATCVDSGTCGSQSPRDLLPTSFALFFLCSIRSFILSKTNVTNWCLSSRVLFLFRALIQFSSPTNSVAILFHTLPRLCHLHLCFHLVWFAGSRSTILVCRERHHLVLLHL